MKILIGLIGLLCFSAWADVQKAQKQSNAWDVHNDPFKMNPNFENRLDALPLTGELSSKALAWPGNYWPNFKGGIAHRWSSEKPQNFKYESPSLYEAKQMSKQQINELSPAEKYDLFSGNYDYPTVREVWKSTGPHANVWYGICHGVSPASLNHPEPKTVSLNNPDGIAITFYASDVKALLAYYYAKESDSDMVQVGKR